MSRILLWVLFLALGLPVAAGAEGKPNYEEKSAYGPIQKRVFDLDHELTLSLTSLPLNPYYKGYGLTVAYTVHLSQVWALELFRVGISFNLDTSLKRKIIEQTAGLPTPASAKDFPAVVVFENTNLILKVLYGKHTALNRPVIHWEIFTTFGAALAISNPYNVTKIDMSLANFDLGVNGGIGFRIWMSESWSFRVDIRDTLLFWTINKLTEFPNESVVEISAGFALSNL